MFVLVLLEPTDPGRSRHPDAIRIIVQNGLKRTKLAATMGTPSMLQAKRASHSSAMRETSRGRSAMDSLSRLFPAEGRILPRPSQSVPEAQPILPEALPRPPRSITLPLFVSAASNAPTSF